jgi:uncharacterized glyoxalase superfamily protein PhnB
MATVVPYLSYRDAAAALAFLSRAFGLAVTTRWDDGGVVQHAEVMLGDGAVMIGTADHPAATVTDRSVGQGVYLVVDDVEATFARALDAGATVVFEPEETEWGTRRAGVLDPEGYEWSLGSYRPGAAGG